MNSFWKDLNSYNQGQKRALMAIWFLIALSIAVSLLQKNFFQPTPEVPFMDSTLTKWAIEQLKANTRKEPVVINRHFNPNTDSVEKIIEAGVPERLANNIVKLRNTGKKYKSAHDLKAIYGMDDSIFSKILPYIILDYNSDNDKLKPLKDKNDNTEISIKETFDPNYTPVEKLIAIGFPEKVANTINNYRNKGGKFEKPEDLLKIYTIDSTIYKQIEPFISITTTKEVVVEVTKIELNTTSAIDLSKTTGLEKDICFKITHYRDKLGGFLHYEQLNEIEEVTSSTIENITQNTWLDPIQIKKIPLNNADFQALIRHPYIDKIFTKKILRYRNFVKIIKTPEELLKNRVATKKELEKILPYLSFE